MAIQSILKTMQEIDPNGEWLQAIEDIENDDDTMSNVIDCIKDTLCSWYYDSEDGSIECQTIKNLINEVKKL